MPVHDWTRVDAGIFHDFHGDWIQVLKHTLNAGLLPPDYYALSEQRAAGTGPDVLALKGPPPEGDPPAGGRPGGALLAPPRTRVVEQSDGAFYRRRQNTVTVRHASDDRPVAVVGIVSPGNKNSRNPFRAFVDKAADLLFKKVHLLILDVHPPGRWDPDGVHGAVWEEVDGRPYARPADKPLTAVAYECHDGVTAYVEPVAVGDPLPDMPLFLVPGGCVLVPTERTYQAAWEGLPARWRRVVDPGS